MNRTIYYEDFAHYYQRAKHLQNNNLFKIQNPNTPVHPSGDPLQDTITIYDTVNRRYAGFSKVLEDLTGRAPHRFSDYGKMSNLEFVDWLYLFMAHRFTGSGASFERDHGYRNTCIFDLVNKEGGMLRFVEWLEKWDKEQPRPIFTSIGNQPPAMKKDDRYNKASTNYFLHYLPAFCYEAKAAIESTPGIGIRQLTDWALAWNKVYDIRQFHFVYTAWAMDVAEYFPGLVSPHSQVYYGKNCVEAFELMYSGRINHDACMDDLCSTLGSLPYDMEDVSCDYIRYIENYIPKGNTYKDIDRKTLWNTSMIKNHSKGRQLFKMGTPEWVW